MHRLPQSTVAIIGAGPYGVSIAAHLQSKGIDFRIFGKPMQRWAHMPKGMFLRSEGCASSLSDPAGRCTLARYCAEAGIPYGERGAPVSLEIFTQYSLFFQRSLAPTVEEVMVTSVDVADDEFELRLANGETVRAGKVIVATGMEHSAHIPTALSRLPPELLSHSADHYDLSRFQGRDVTVIGGGQSALETAALLSEQAASVRLLVRKPSLSWNAAPGRVQRSFYQRLRHPVSNLGVGLEIWISSAAPLLLHHLPQRIRVARVKTVLGPAGAWWLKDRVIGRLPVLLGHCVQAAEARDGRAVLQVTGQEGRVSHLKTDHVIAATGYQFDLQRLPFLSPTLKSRLHAEQRVPQLSSGFESSVRGFYFTGLSSAYSFGPAMRFLHGADFTARRVSGDIAAKQRQSRSSPAFHLVRSAQCKEF